MKDYFHLAESFIGHVYFKVSEHLRVPVSEVIRKKFLPDYKFLIFKYSQILRDEIRQMKELNDEIEGR